MSSSIHVTLWCDAPWCSKWTDHGRSSLRVTRNLARAEGWVIGRGGDFCCASHAAGNLTRAEREQAAYDARQALRGEGLN